MKTLGLVGGTTWLSTVDYYRYINEGINKRTGGVDFARCIIYSLNITELRKHTDISDWKGALEMVSKVCKNLEQSGAEAIVLCANTLHNLAEGLKKNINIPIIHIAEAAACEIKKFNLKKTALLGTKFTMELDFFKSKLTEQNIETIIPGENDRDFINFTIYNELGRNIFKAETKQRYLEIIGKLAKQGAEGVILGCTEIPLLIKQADLNVPAFDTTKIHSDAAVDFALSE